MTERAIPKPVPREVPRERVHDDAHIRNVAQDDPHIGNVAHDEAHIGEAAHDQAHVRAVNDSRTPLFDDHEGHGLRARWEAIQTGFVDEPRAAVEQADALVNQVMSRLTQVFADERTALEQQWTRGDNVSTEELRVALKRYRSFFERLLSV